MTMLRMRKLRINPPQVIALGFIIIILIGSFLLSLPIASEDGIKTPYLNALFMATSAVCVTGLSVFNVGGYYSLFGEIVILLLVQIGGLGFMTMASLLALAFKRRISFRERLILQEALNHESTQGIVSLIRKVLYYVLIIEGVGILLLTIRWLFEMPFWKALYFGVFHTISIFNNAGFDLFGGEEGHIGGFLHFAEDPFVNLVTIVLIFLGGIGFIVISDLVHYPKFKKLTLHSKVVLTMSGGLVILGAIVIFVFEFSNPQTFQPLTLSGKFLSSFLQSTTSRSAGMLTVDVGSLRQATQFFLVILMFIGAAPGSSGGGIKVTTFAILVGAIVTMIRGKEDIVMFRYRIAADRIYKAITLTLFSFIIIVIATMLLSITESFSFLGILFEVTSAYATTGMSMGLTPNLSQFGKIVIILLMFIGRFGPITMAYILVPKPDKVKYRYPEGKITIG